MMQLVDLWRMVFFNKQPWGKIMHTSNGLLDAAALELGGVSDYRIAKLIGCGASRISNYRTGRATMNDEMAARVAELAGFSAEYGIACVGIERAPNDYVKRIYRRIAKHANATSAACLLPLTTLAVWMADVVPIVCILCEVTIIRLMAAFSDMAHSMSNQPRVMLLCNEYKVRSVPFAILPGLHCEQ
jgi:hypothetical protein